MQTNVHITVLLQTTIDLLDIHPGDIVLDGTLGAAGHSLEVLRQTSGNIQLIGIDMDQKALERSQERIQEAGYEEQALLLKGNFAEAEQLLQKNKIEKVDKIILDLGFSSNQLEVEGRGFSFLRDEPLLMTLSDDAQDVTAYDVVNHWAEESIADIIWGFGDERFARRIARAIVEARKIQTIKTTFDLVCIIENSVPKFYKNGKIHPATRTFQAIRIAVNKELESLKAILESVPRILSKHGRIGIISFHSLEDRVVKRSFLKLEMDGIGKRITKKPVVPNNDEIQVNSRSRSAKLRVFQII
jgi:16S rRNA (cytosine1402-N4)-methyltransferase